MSGVNRGQREHKGIGVALGDIQNKGVVRCSLDSIGNLWAISPLKLPSLNTDLYRLPTTSPSTDVSRSTRRAAGTEKDVCLRASRSLLPPKSSLSCRPRRGAPGSASGPSASLPYGSKLHCCSVLYHIISCYVILQYIVSHHITYRSCSPISYYICYTDRVLLTASSWMRQLLKTTRDESRSI